MHNKRQSLGKRGEEWVAQLLRERGWQLIARNWRRPGLELDLVAQRGSDLIIFEVKCRRNPQALLDPFQVFSWRKQQNLLRGVRYFLARHPSLETETIRIYLAVLSPQGLCFLAKWHPIEMPEV